MSDDWQVGDLALCIDDKMLTVGRIKRGGIYTVDGVCVGKLKSGGETTVLDLREVPQIIGFVAWRFIKVTPPEADEFDREVIELLNGTPVPVEA